MTITFKRAGGPCATEREDPKVGIEFAGPRGRLLGGSRCRRAASARRVFVSETATPPVESGIVRSPPGGRIEEGKMGAADGAAAAVRWVDGAA